MDSKTILVLGAGKNNNFWESLFAMGLIPLAVDTIQGVIEKLKRGDHFAVLVDRDRVHLDVLEMILNVRDINPQIPIVVIGTAPDQSTEKAIAAQSATFVITRDEARFDLAGTLENIFYGKGRKIG